MSLKKTLFRKILEDTTGRTWIAQYCINNSSSYIHIAELDLNRIAFTSIEINVFTVRTAYEFR